MRGPLGDILEIHQYVSTVQEAFSDALNHAAPELKRTPTPEILRLFLADKLKAKYGSVIVTSEGLRSQSEPEMARYNYAIRLKKDMPVLFEFSVEFNCETSEVEETPAQAKERIELEIALKIKKLLSSQKNLEDNIANKNNELRSLKERIRAIEATSDLIEKLNENKKKWTPFPRTPHHKVLTGGEIFNLINSASRFGLVRRDQILFDQFQKNYDNQQLDAILEEITTSRYSCLLDKEKEKCSDCAAYIADAEKKLAGLKENIRLENKPLLSDNSETRTKRIRGNILGVKSIPDPDFSIISILFGAFNPQTLEENKNLFNTLYKTLPPDQSQTKEAAIIKIHFLALAAKNLGIRYSAEKTDIDIIINKEIITLLNRIKELNQPIPAFLVTNVPDNTLNSLLLTGTTTIAGDDQVNKEKITLEDVIKLYSKRVRVFKNLIVTEYDHKFDNYNLIGPEHSELADWAPNQNCFDNCEIQHQKITFPSIQGLAAKNLAIPISFDLTDLTQKYNAQKSSSNEPAVSPLEFLFMNTKSATKEREAFLRQYHVQALIDNANNGTFFDSWSCTAVELTTLIEQARGESTEFPTNIDFKTLTVSQPVDLAIFLPAGLPREKLSPANSIEHLRKLSLQVENATFKGGFTDKENIFGKMSETEKNCGLENVKSFSNLIKILLDQQQQQSSPTTPIPARANGALAKASKTRASEIENIILLLQKNEPREEIIKELLTLLNTFSTIPPEQTNANEVKSKLRSKSIENNNKDKSIELIKKVLTTLITNINSNLHKNDLDFLITGLSSLRQQPSGTKSTPANREGSPVVNNPNTAGQRRTRYEIIENIINEHGRSSSPLKVVENVLTLLDDFMKIKLPEHQFIDTSYIQSFRNRSKNKLNKIDNRLIEIRDVVDDFILKINDPISQEKGEELILPLINLKNKLIKQLEEHSNLLLSKLRVFIDKIQNSSFNDELFEEFKNYIENNFKNLEEKLLCPADKAAMFSSLKRKLNTSNPSSLTEKEENKNKIVIELLRKIFNNFRTATSTEKNHLEEKITEADLKALLPYTTSPTSATAIEESPTSQENTNASKPSATATRQSSPSSSNSEITTIKQQHTSTSNSSSQLNSAAAATRPSSLSSSSTDNGPTTTQQQKPAATDTPTPPPQPKTINNNNIELKKHQNEETGEETIKLLPIKISTDNQITLTTLKNSLTKTVSVDLAVFYTDLCAAYADELKKDKLSFFRPKSNILKLEDPIKPLTLVEQKENLTNLLENLKDQNKRTKKALYKATHRAQQEKINVPGFTLNNPNKGKNIQLESIDIPKTTNGIIEFKFLASDLNSLKINVTEFYNALDKAYENVLKEDPFYFPRKPLLQKLKDQKLPQEKQIEHLLEHARENPNGRTAKAFFAVIKEAQEKKFNDRIKDNKTTIDSFHTITNRFLSNCLTTTPLTEFNPTAPDTYLVLSSYDQKTLLSLLEATEKDDPLKEVIATQLILAVRAAFTSDNINHFTKNKLAESNKSLNAAAKGLRDIPEKVNDWLKKNEKNLPELEKFANSPYFKAPITKNSFVTRDIHDKIKRRIAFLKKCEIALNMVTNYIAGTDPLQLSVDKNSNTLLTLLKDREKLIGELNSRIVKRTLENADSMICHIAVMKAFDMVLDTSVNADDDTIISDDAVLLQKKAEFTTALDNLKKTIEAASKAAMLIDSSEQKAITEKFIQIVNTFESPAQESKLNSESWKEFTELANKENSYLILSSAQKTELIEKLTAVDKPDRNSVDAAFARFLRRIAENAPEKEKLIENPLDESIRSANNQKLREDATKGKINTVMNIWFASNKNDLEKLRHFSASNLAALLEDASREDLKDQIDDRIETLEKRERILKDNSMAEKLSNAITPTLTFESLNDFLTYFDDHQNAYLMLEEEKGRLCATLQKMINDPSDFIKQPIAVKLLEIVNTAHTHNELLRMETDNDFTSSHKKLASAITEIKNLDNHALFTQWKSTSEDWHNLSALRKIATLNFIQNSSNYKEIEAQISHLDAIQERIKANIDITKIFEALIITFIETSKIDISRIDSLHKMLTEEGGILILSPDTKEKFSIKTDNTGDQMIQLLKQIVVLAPTSDDMFNLSYPELNGKAEEIASCLEKLLELQNNARISLPSISGLFSTSRENVSIELLASQYATNPSVDLLKAVYCAHGGDASKFETAAREPSPNGLEKLKTWLKQEDLGTRASHAASQNAAGKTLNSLGLPRPNNEEVSAERKKRTNMNGLSRTRAF